MHSDSSFGGANRGPASMRKGSRRSNIFVDLGFVVLLVACAAVIGYQYQPLISTGGYNVAAGHIRRVACLSDATNYGYSNYGSRLAGPGYRRSSWFDMLKVDYTFNTSGKTYKGSAISVPLFCMASLPVYNLRSTTEPAGLAVRYDPANPERSVPVEVVDTYTKSAMATYIVIFIVGSILLILAGMSNLSGERWSPFRNSDAY